MGQLEKVITVQLTNAKSFEGTLKIRVHQKNWTEALTLAERVEVRFSNEPTGSYFSQLVRQAKKLLPENIKQFESGLAVLRDAVQLISKSVTNHLILGQQEFVEQYLGELYLSVKC